MQHRPEYDRWTLQAVLDVVPAHGPGDFRVLDVASGLGRNGFTLWENDVPGRRVGLELFEDYLHRSRGLGIYDLLVRGDLNEGLPFADGSIDVVLCNDVLVVLDRPSGERLLAECQRVARRRVVVTTETRGRAAPHPAGPHETLKSAWGVKDLRERGFEVRGFGSALATGHYGGRRFLYGYYAGTLLAALAPAAGDEAFATWTRPGVLR